MLYVCRCVFSWLAVVTLCLTFSVHAAHARVDKERPGDKVIDIPLGSAQTVRVPVSVDKIVVGDPQICDVVPLPPGQLLLIGKAPGETMITIWSREGGITSYRIVASIPVSALQVALREALPNEEDLQVHASGGAVYLTGTVADAASAEAAARIAHTIFASSGRKLADIVNLVSVATAQQVQLHMRFVEITRSNMRDMGFNAWINNDTMSGGMTGPNQPFHYCLTCDTQRFVGPANPLAVEQGTNNPANPWLPIITSPISGTFGLSFATTKILPLTATLALLEARGVAKTLSEPTMVTQSGEEAQFLVGGEIPIPVPDALGHILLQFKSYGAQVTFTPTVLSGDTIHLKLYTEVSELDKTNGINLASVSVPALQTRKSGTGIRMRDGQSFAIAGLLSDNITNSNSKIPLLGDIPVIGALFRSVTATRAETELVIVISVRLVKPLDPGEVPAMLHQEEFVDPSDTALFLMGFIDNTRDPESAPAKRSSRAQGSSMLPGGTLGGPVGAIGFSR